MIHDRDYMRNPQPPRWNGVMLPDAVIGIIVLNVLVFLLQYVGFGIFSDSVPVGGGRTVIQPWGGFSLQALMEGRVWTLFTHMFVHGGPFHLLGNCLMIAFSGKALKPMIGTRYFLMIYFFSGVAGALLEMLVGVLIQEPKSMIGASACAMGITTALAVLLPQQMITALIAFVIPINMRFGRLVMLFMGISLVMGVLQIFHVWDNLMPNIAHFAHIGGGLGGWLFMRALGYGKAPVNQERLWNDRQRHEDEPEYAGIKSRKREKGMEPPMIYPVVDSKKDFIAREIDPLLEKILAHGIGSLSKEERELLERAHVEIKSREKR